MWTPNDVLADLSLCPPPEIRDAQETFSRIAALGDDALRESCTAFYAEWLFGGVRKLRNLLGDLERMKGIKLPGAHVLVAPLTTQSLPDRGSVVGGGIPADRATHLLLGDIPGDACIRGYGWWSQALVWMRQFRWALVLYLHVHAEGTTMIQAELSALAEYDQERETLHGAKLTCLLSFFPHGKTVGLLRQILTADLLCTHGPPKAQEAATLRRLIDRYLRGTRRPGVAHRLGPVEYPLTSAQRELLCSLAPVSPRERDALLAERVAAEQGRATADLVSQWRPVLQRIYAAVVREEKRDTRWRLVSEGIREEESALPYLVEYDEWSSPVALDALQSTCRGVHGACAALEGNHAAWRSLAQKAREFERRTSRLLGLP